MKQMAEQMSISDLGIWSGRTSPEPCPLTREKTSEPSSKRPPKWSKKTPIYLDLRRGGWSYSGCIMGDGWSIAWRIHDAQFWGVPQRRKRIALVADFGGGSAPEILFVRKGLSRDTEPSKQERQGTAGNPSDCT